MRASKENPIYTVRLLDDSTEYNLTAAVLDIDFADREKQLAQSVTINVANGQSGGTTLADILKVRQRIFISADDGTTNDEVFRGVIWTKYCRDALSDEEIQIKCYDNLIYMQESEDSQYFTAGQASNSVIQQLCDNWGVQLDYSYASITHEKLVLRGNLSDIIISDVLDKVKKQTGQSFVILSIKDVLTIRPVGQNTTVYEISEQNNAVQTRTEQTMDGMITKVVILGKAGNDERKPVEATVDGDTAQYGTLQKIIDASGKDENTSLADAQKEANNIIKESGTPKIEYEVQAPDIPWIRKGDKVRVDAGDIYGKELIVLAINRSISNKSKMMTLTLEDTATASSDSGAATAETATTDTLDGISIAEISSTDAPESTQNAEFEKAVSITEWIAENES